MRGVLIPFLLLLQRIPPRRLSIVSGSDEHAGYRDSKCVYITGAGHESRFRRRRGVRSGQIHRGQRYGRMSPIHRPRCLSSRRRVGDKEGILELDSDSSCALVLKMIMLVEGTLDWISTLCNGPLCTWLHDAMEPCVHLKDHIHLPTKLIGLGRIAVAIGKQLDREIFAGHHLL